MKKPDQLPEKVVAQLLPRLKDEMDAFYFYRSAYNWCQNGGFRYAAKFFNEESADELKHARMIEKFLTDWNVMPVLPALTLPEKDFAGLIDIIEKAYEIEYDLYESYEKTAEFMLKEDICTFKLTQDLLAIQQKSIAQYSDFLNQAAVVNVSNGLDLYILEKRLFKHA